MELGCSCSLGPFPQPRIHLVGTGSPWGCASGAARAPRRLASPRDAPSSVAVPPRAWTPQPGPRSSRSPRTLSRSDGSRHLSRALRCSCALSTATHRWFRFGSGAWRGSGRTSLGRSSSCWMMRAMRTMRSGLRCRVGSSSATRLPCLRNGRRDGRQSGRRTGTTNAAGICDKRGFYGGKSDPK